MNKMLMIWKNSESILDIDKRIDVRQIYIWITTKDKKILVVSKDGKKWQLPGGKPNKDESFSMTALRELKEETGLSINNSTSKLKFFGYYLVLEFDTLTNEIKDRFLQLRCNLSLKNNSNNYEPKPEEPEGKDPIKYAKFCEYSDLIKKMPWLDNSSEYSAFMNIVGISDTLKEASIITG